MTDTAKAVAEGRRTTSLEAELAARADSITLVMPTLPDAAYRPTDEPVDALIGNELAGQYGGWWE